MQLLAINAKSLKKYSYQLITDDHGILNESNLRRYVDGIIPEPFHWNVTGFDYWQCFATKNVSAWYEKGEYDSDEEITRGHPHLTVKNNSVELQDYVVRRRFSLDYAKEKVAKWKQLMKNQEDGAQIKLRNDKAFSPLHRAIESKISSPQLNNHSELTMLQDMTKLLGGGLG